MLTVVTDQTFTPTLAAATTPVLLKVYAPWCGPCKMLAPILEAMSQQRTDLTFLELNADENEATVQDLKVMSLPTVILFQNGQEVARVTGYQREADLVSKLLGKLA